MILLGWLSLEKCQLMEYEDFSIILTEGIQLRLIFVRTEK